MTIFGLTKHTEVGLPRHNDCRSKGMTMLELVMGIALFLIISLGIVILIDAYRPYSRLLPEGIFRTGVRRIHSETLEDIKQSVRQAERILATTSIDSANYTTGTTTIALRLRSVDAANNLIPGSYDQIVYYTNTTTPPITLYKQVAGAFGSKRTSRIAILNELVDNLSFTYNTSTPRDATSIEIALVTRREIVSMNVRASSTIRATLR